MSDHPSAPVVATRRRLWHTVLTGLSQGASLLGVAVLGLLIAAKFGSTPVTDGFFIAQSIYGIALLMGQSLRTTAVAGLTRRDGGAGETLGAVLLIGLVLIVLFAAVAWQLVPTLTSSLPEQATEMAQRSLLLLGPAALLQLLAGAFAALLAARDRVAVSAGAFGAGTLVGLVAFLPLRALVGDLSLPLVLTLMSLSSCGLLFGAVLRSGGLEWRRPSPRVMGGRALELTIGSVALLVGQVVVAVTVAFAGQVGPHASTTYSYASMALNLVVATVVSPAMLILAPVLATEWAGDTRSLVALAGRIFRLGAILVVPAIASVVLIGMPVLSLLFAETGKATVSDISAVLLALSPVALATLMALVPELGLVTRHRFTALARIAAGVLVVHVAAGGAAVALGGDVVDLALVATTTSLLSAAAAVWVGADRSRGAVYAGAALGTARLVVVPALAYVAVALILKPGQQLGAGAATWLVGTVLAGAWVITVHRAELTELLAVARGTAAPELPAE